MTGIPLVLDLSGPHPSSAPWTTTDAGVALAPKLLARSQGFLQRHLVPRISQQLGRVTPIYALEVDRARWQQSELHDWFSGTAGHYARRGLLKATKSYLLEATPIGSMVDSLRVSRDGFGRPRDKVSATDYGVRVSHGRPLLDIRHRSAAGTIRFGIGLDGSVLVKFRHAHTATGHFSAGYDARESRFSVSFRTSY